MTRYIIENTDYITATGDVNRRFDIRVDGGKIREITPHGTNPRDPEATVIDGKGKIVIPGLYNTHCHVPMVLLRGYGENLPLQRWLTEKIFPFEALLNADDMYWGSLLGIAEQLRSGIVSFTDMYMRLTGIATAVLETGIKANLSNPLAESEPVPFRDTRSYTETLQIIEMAADDRAGRLVVDAGIHAEYSSMEYSVRDTIRFAADNGLRMHIHLSETRAEHENCKQQRGKTPTKYFADCGLFELPVTAAHGVYLEDSDLDILADAEDVTIAHCPSSNLKLGSGIADVLNWKRHGVRWSVGTDGASSNNNLNLLEELHLASMLQKGKHCDPTLMQPAEMLTAVTTSGAASQGRKSCGDIQIGHDADLVMINTDAPHWCPRHDDLANLFYAAQIGDIAMTMVNGKILYRDGEFTTIDIEKVKAVTDRIIKEKLALL